jgi:hypothetical protein
LLEEEEAAALKKKASPKAGSKKAAKPAGPGAIAAAGAGAAESAEPLSSSKNGGEPEEIESFAATGIDNVLDLVDVVTAKMDKASVGNQAASTVEKHPEVRALIVPELVVAPDIFRCRDESRCPFFFKSCFTSCLRRLKAAFNAYVDRELPIIRAEVCSPSPRFAGSALTIVIFTATWATPTAI